jgi:hypothetical protein
MLIHISLGLLSFLLSLRFRRPETNPAKSRRGAPPMRSATEFFAVGSFPDVLLICCFCQKSEFCQKPAVMPVIARNMLINSGNFHVRTTGQKPVGRWFESGPGSHFRSTQHRRLNSQRYTVEFQTRSLMANCSRNPRTPFPLVALRGATYLSSADAPVRFSGSCESCHSSSTALCDRRLDS